MDAVEAVYNHTQFTTTKNKIMTAKEVQIGDWLYDRYTKRQVQVSTYTFQYCEEWGDFEPIPLTPEILKANGFNIRRDTYYLSCDFFGNDSERCGIEIKFYDRAVIDIECNYTKHTNRIHLVADYVHELQRALKLCGLNDIADSFKV